MDDAPADAVYISLGANLDSPEATLLRAFDRLAALSPAPVVRSSLWRTAPVDCPPDSPMFINAIAALTPLPGETPETLLAKLKAIEQEFGRTPKRVLNEARNLDLDLILFGRQIRSAPHVVLPHPRAHLRGFVLEPLAEVAPDLVWPGLGITVAELRAALPAEGPACVRLPGA